MLILPQKTRIKWRSNTRQHYEDLGYYFTKYGDYFLVDVTDLSKGSEILVKVKCDYCDNIVDMPWKRYLKLRGDTYCCEECLKHRKKTRDENGELVFVEIPYRNKAWLYNEYIVKGREAKDIADECGITLRSLRRWIEDFDLTIKQDKSGCVSKEDLYDMYENKKMSTIEIACKLGVTDNSVSSWLKKNGINVRTASEAAIIANKEKGANEKRRKTCSSLEHRIKLSCIQRGISEDEFDGFLTDEDRRARTNSQYKEWQRKVFDRDDFTCQCCGKRGGNLNAHHLYNFSDYKDLRYNTENGITLCEECHLVNYKGSFHSIYGERNNTPEQLYEYISNKKEKAN